MASEKDSQALFERVAGLRQQLAKQLGADLVGNPQLAEALVQQVDDLVASALAAQAAEPPPPDLGVAQLAGIGEGAAQSLGETRLPPGIAPYDETVTSERITAVGDLYYLYQHEALGVFTAVSKLQSLFRAGTVRLSSGEGAYRLYQFDRRNVLRYTRPDRFAAYSRVLGYGAASPPRGGRRNAEFHPQFSHFINQVALFWRDKRISDVIRERANDPSFGSIAVVRRAGLDLRNNLKFASFGHLNVLRVELMQVLDEAFRVLEADDVKRLYGADTGWDTLEEILLRHFSRRLETSPRQRMAVNGRDILRWLGQPHILQSSRAQFEALLLEIAEAAEEWFVSAESMGTAQRRGGARVLPFQGRAPLSLAAGSRRP